MRYVLLALALGANIQNVAFAQDRDVHIFTEGPISKTLVSGNVGSVSTVVASPAPTNTIRGSYFLTELRFNESGNSPCYVRAGFSAWDMGADWPHYDNPIYASKSLLPCGSLGDGGFTGETVIAQPAPVVKGYTSYAAIHGIQVCTNDRNVNNIKVKGVKILVTRVNANGRDDIVRHGSFADSFERNNCRKWEDAVRCPVGEIAVSLVVHSRARNITGLGLHCQAIRLWRDWPEVADE